MTSPDRLMKFRFCFSSPSQSVLSPGEERGCGKGSWPETKRSACNPPFLSLLGEAPRIWGKWGDDEPVPSALQARAPRLSALGPVTPVFDTHSHREQGFPGDSGSKESASHAGDPGSVSASGRSPGEGNGNPLQYSRLRNSMDRGARRTTIHGIAKTHIELSN